MTKPPVLVVDDDVMVRTALVQSLELADYPAIAAGSFVAAKDHITRDFTGVILSDIRMPGRDGFHLLSYALEIDEELPVILLTGEGDIPMAVRAMEQGAFDFLEKPCAASDLIAALDRAVAQRADVLGTRALVAEREAGDPAARLIFGVSDLAEGLRARVRRLARAEGAVLVTGAPGTGVSKVAEVLHLCSDRAQGPFEKRAGAGLSPQALAQALAAAGGGSLFIDQVHMMPADTQLALIEALDSDSAARVIAGSTDTLSEAGDQINPELYYRLQVMTVRIPALAERPEDIPVLFRHYVSQACEQAGLAPPSVTPDVIAGLMARDWPGNARALMSEAMRFALDLQDDIAPQEGLGLAEQMAQIEQSLLEAALRRAGGRASEAAQALKLPRKTFYDKLARYGIKPEQFRG
ncbi:sigma-54-dependent transcriptional regulator [Aestuariivita boseongensis]|uniref:sigma-54-dependent transcriptional regulator n=1 Tax=Aestuariivita boseongensis TaxID=1470562 RepID=UPI00067FD454|nr:response regulator [Aestuariivita boseongensis]